MISKKELNFILYREDLRQFFHKWNDNDRKDIPIAVGNSLLSIEDALKQVDYKIFCEVEDETNK